MCFCNALKIFQTLYVFFIIFVPGTWSTSGNCIGNIHQYRFNRGKRRILMMLRDAVDCFLRNSIFFEDGNAQFNMTSLTLSNYFSDIMKKTTKANNINISSDFLGQGNANLGFLHRMGNHVLPVGEAILKSPQKRYDRSGQIVNTHAMGKFLPFFKHDAIDLAFDLQDDLLNAAWLYTTIFEKPFKR